MTEEKLEIEDAVAILSGEPEDIKEEIENRQVSTDDLEHLYKAEESGEEREKVLKMLRREIKHRKVAGVLDAAKEDVETLEEALEKVKELEGVDTERKGFENLESNEIIDLMAGDVKHMQEFLEEHRPNEESLKQLLEAEKKLNNREEAIELIKETIERERLEVNMAEAEEDIESLEESVERLQKTSQDVEPKAEDQSDEAKEGPEEDANSEEEQEDSEEDEETDSESEEDNQEDLGKKEKLVEELGVDLTDEEMESVSIEELEQLKDEKKKREKIIESLKEQGMDEEELRQASTDDLEKIKEEMDSSEEEKKEAEEKSKEEMEKEAEEDLQMLMGAGKKDEKNEEEKEESSSKLESMKEKLNSRFNSEESEEEEGSELDDAKFRDVLNEYQELGEEESIIKTAHITKGYLERELGIERELTYRELADEIPEDTEELQKLAEMFKKLNKEQYTQRISFESEAFIETCRSAVDDLER